MCDFYGTVLGHTLSTSDGVQAYVQALLRGPKTWVEIPRVHWPEDWVGKYERPVVVLHKALYGHPNAGAFWESECNQRVSKLGWVQFGEWPSVYWHQVVDSCWSYTSMTSN